MRKALLSFFIAVLIAPTMAFGETHYASFDVGTASANRRAYVFVTCDECGGVDAVSVGETQLTRDVRTSSPRVAEIWSAPLPLGQGTQMISVKATAALGDVRVEGATSIGAEVLAETLAGQKAYAPPLKNGDLVCAAGSSNQSGDRPPWGSMEAGHSKISCWEIRDQDVGLRISGDDLAVAIYRRP